MKILHLSDTTLSGSPIRIAGIFNKYTDYQARHIVWDPIVYGRVFPTDMVGSTMSREQLLEQLEWADVIHYHNRYRRQKIFKWLGIDPPKKPSVVQIHSPRESEDFSEELELPIAVIAQYHVRQWPEAKFIVPNAIDIFDPMMMPMERNNALLKVSYAPSNTNAKGWDDKGYGYTAPILKRMSLAHEIDYKLIIKKPWEEAMRLKRSSDVGIDELITGSYHLSSLEYLSMGVPTLANLDDLTVAAIKGVTGAEYIPWDVCPVHRLRAFLDTYRKDKDFLIEEQREVRRWMEKYWHPHMIAGRYIGVYEKL